MLRSKALKIKDNPKLTKNKFFEGDFKSKNREPERAVVTRPLM